MRVDVTDNDNRYNVQTTRRSISPTLELDRGFNLIVFRVQRLSEH
jgi:hypothetical protein